MAPDTRPQPDPNGTAAAPPDGSDLDEMLRELDTMPDLLTTAEVAVLFRVSKSTVDRWVAEGRLSYFRTLGRQGHRRFPKADVRALLDAVDLPEDRPLPRLAELYKPGLPVGEILLRLDAARVAIAEHRDSGGRVQAQLASDLKYHAAAEATASAYGYAGALALLDGYLTGRIRAVPPGDTPDGEKPQSPLADPRDQVISAAIRYVIAYDDDTADPDIDGLYQAVEGVTGAPIGSADARVHARTLEAAQDRLDLSVAVARIRNEITACDRQIARGDGIREAKARRGGLVSALEQLGEDTP